MAGRPPSEVVRCHSTRRELATCVWSACAVALSMSPRTASATADSISARAVRLRTHHTPLQPARDTSSDARMADLPHDPPLASSLPALTGQPESVAGSRHRIFFRTSTAKIRPGEPREGEGELLQPIPRRLDPHALLEQRYPVGRAASEGVGVAELRGAQGKPGVER